MLGRQAEARVAGKVPKGYEEVGEGLAQAVAEGHQPKAWLIELGALAGYGRVTAAKWLTHYRETHAAELEALQLQPGKRVRRPNGGRRSTGIGPRKGAGS